MGARCRGMRLIGASAGIMAIALICAGCGIGPGPSQSPEQHPTEPANRANLPKQKNLVERFAQMTAAHHMTHVQVISPNAMWAQSAHQVWRSLSGGKTWTEVGAVSGRIVALRAVNAQNAWMAVVPSPSSLILTVRHTTDGGRHWSAQSVTAPWPAAAPVTRAEFSLLAGSQGWLFAGGEPLNMGSSPVALWAIDHGRVASTPVYKSDTAQMGDVQFPTASQGWAIGGGEGAQSASPALWSSSDYGRQWHPVLLPLPAHTLNAHAANPKMLPEIVAMSPPEFVSAQQGFLLTDLGTWSDSGGIMHPHNRDVLYRTANGGKSWQPWLPLGNHIKTIAMMDWMSPQNGWMAAFSSQSPALRLYATSDGGAQWKMLTLLKPPNYVSLRFVSAYVGWYISRSSNEQTTMMLEKTTNRGASWTVVP